MVAMRQPNNLSLAQVCEVTLQSHHISTNTLDDTCLIAGSNILYAYFIYTSLMSSNLAVLVCCRITLRSQVFVLQVALIDIFMCTEQARVMLFCEGIEVSQNRSTYVPSQ